MPNFDKVRINYELYGQIIKERKRLGLPVGYDKTVKDKNILSYLGKKLIDKETKEEWTITTIWKSYGPTGWCYECLFENAGRSSGRMTLADINLTEPKEEWYLFNRFDLVK